MAFLDKAGLQNLTKKIVQGDAIKVASSKGTTVKEVIDNIQRECESVALPNTMILENRVNEFKVGQGRDIDVSRDVEEGLSQIQLQGQTYQNLFATKPINTTINSTTHSGYMRTIFDLSNKMYSFIFDIATLNGSGAWVFIRGQGKNTPFGEYSRKYITSPGKYILTVDLSSGKDCFQILCGFNGTGNCTIENTLLLEGDYTQIPIKEIPQYFEGIKSSFEDKVANITVQGENLFDKSKTENMLYNYFINNDGNIQGAKDTLTIRQKVKPNTKYSLNGNYNRSAVRFEDKNKEYISHTSNKIVTTPSNCEYIVWYVGNEAIKDNTVDNLQIEEAAVGTSFEPYYSYNYKFDIKEPLRRLPNGICDEIRNNNGKWELVRRTSKIIIDHTVDFNKEAQHNNTIRFILSWNFATKYKIKTSSNGLCDKIPFHYENSDDIFHCRFDGSTPYASFKIWIDKNKLNSEDAQGLKTWLQVNPITVYGELAEPIITPIDPIKFNVSQGTTININSDIPPISTHEVILNRSGQIEQGIELIADLRSRIDKLEKVYDSNLIATQYRLNNLKLNYELEREED